MRLSKVHLSIVALIAANFIWGAAAPILKWSLDDIEPFTLGFLRFLLAALIILPFIIHKLKIQKRDIFYVALLGFIGFNLHIGGLLWGVKLAPSINAPIIASAAPIFIILGSIAFLKEHPKKQVILGTILSLLGVITVVLRPLLEEGSGNGSLTGNLFLVSGTFALVIFTMMLKKIEGKYNPLTLLFWMTAFAAVFFLPFAVYESYTTNVFMNDLTTKGLIGILYSAVFAHIIAHLGFIFALKYVSASDVGIYLYMDPVIAVIIAIPLLGETITPFYLIGSLFVFAGIFIAEGRIQYHPLHLFKKHRR